MNTIPETLPCHGSDRRWKAGCRCSDCVSAQMVWLFRTRRGAQQ